MIFIICTRLSPFAKLAVIDVYSKVLKSLKLVESMWFKCKMV